MEEHKQDDLYRYDLKIPKERVAVLIGKDGQVKTDLEGAAKCKVEVDSKEGDVFITGKDPILLYSAREVIHAVGRGFNPDIAFMLFKQDYMFELINILDFAKTKNDIVRLKGRIIGTEGKSRAVLEQLTECFICVYGKTIGVIGELEYVPIARKAVEMLLEGSNHSNVFTFLEKQRRKLKRPRLESEEDAIREDAKKFLD